MFIFVKFLIDGCFLHCAHTEPPALPKSGGGISSSISIIYIDNSSMETRNEYIAPRTRVVPLSVENAICGSPQKGGNEDVGYDDWWVE